MPLRCLEPSARLLQSHVIMWKLRRGALDRIQELREMRDRERAEFIRQLRENAATYIQRVFRGIHDRNMVIKMAVEQQVAQAQGRVGGDEDEEEKNMPALVESRKARYQIRKG